MKKVYVILFSLLISSLALAQQSYTLNGIVKDKKGEILPGVGIYVSGYKIATSTNNNGLYSLTLKPGNYDILVQIIGYKALNKNVTIEDKPVRLDIILKESVIQLSEVNIRPDPKRQGYINMFRDFFIGTTPNAQLCKMVNPNVLIIDYDEEEQKLTVKTNQFLIIENQALGYRIKYLLNEFEYNSKSKIIYYEGYPTFEDLKGSKGKLRRWATKRLEAYKGSSQHFFSSLYDGRSKEEGFIINKLIKRGDPNRPADSLINANIKRLRNNLGGANNLIRINNGDSLSYWIKQKNKPKEISILSRSEVLTDTLVRPFNESVKSINYTDVLYVIYTKEREDSMYANRIGLSVSRPLDMPDYQISLINMLVSPVFFYKNGGIYNPRSMLYQGYWAWEKMADSVPLDYLPQ